MENRLKIIYQDYLHKIQQTKDLKSLDEIFLALFGKNGEITLATKEFPKLSKEELKVVAPLLAKVKAELEEAVTKRREEIKEEGYQKLSEEKLDLTPVELPREKGHLHVITTFEEETGQ